MRNYGFFLGLMVLGGVAQYFAVSHAHLQSHHQSLASSSANTVPYMQDHCLMLDRGQDYYPEYGKEVLEDLYGGFTDGNKLAKTTFSIDGEVAHALYDLKNQGAGIDRWPIVFHGPMKLCGSVTLVFNSQDRDRVELSQDRFEIGPNFTVLNDKKTGGITITASTHEPVSIKNIEIDTTCDLPKGSTKHCVEMTGVVRFKNTKDMLSIKAKTAKKEKTCWMQDVDLSNSEFDLTRTPPILASNHDCDQIGLAAPPVSSALDLGKYPPTPPAPAPQPSSGTKQLPPSSQQPQYPADPNVSGDGQPVEVTPVN